MSTTRREFLNQSVKAAVAGALAVPVIGAGMHNQKKLELTQIKLPYAFNALEPYIDAQTMEIHYTKHHAAYVKNVNEALAAENVAVSEGDLFKNISKSSAKIRNNAGGVWNHNFFWSVMKGGGNAQSVPTGKVADALAGAFGSFDKFKEQFTQAAMTRFGSGWAWLIKDQNSLKIGSTPNQDNPLMDVSDLKGEPLLAIDVWEHAYYLKYQNKRNEYVANWWSVVNWEEVGKRLG